MSALLAVASAVGPTSAHPPNATDHGVPTQTFHTLWSGDRDGKAANGSRRNQSAMAQLAAGTDIPLDSPPRAVEQWNRGDHTDFPATSRSVSIHPPDATLTGGQFIQDGYAEIFAVQPSTRVRLSPARQPLYVAPEGTLLGTVDYRVAVPADDTTGDRRVSWRLAHHQIEETTLLVDGDPLSTGGSHTPALSYSLDGTTGETHRVTLRATFSVRLRKEVEVCTAHNNQGDCTDWERSISYPTENVTVSDSISVTKYDLAVSGLLARYPNGDLGLAVYKNQPWLGYQLPNGDVRGVWRFYSARDKDWDTLVYSSDDGQRTAHSPLHPLQVNAYPIETGATPSPRRSVTILDVYGTSTSPPTLPSNVHLDVLTESYTASYGLVTRATTDTRPDTIRAWGLVRGVDAERPADEFGRIQIDESTLSLAVVNQSEDTVTVRVRLRNADTGAAINTAARDGYVVVNGERLNTTGNGTATITIARPPGGVSARYESGHWWLTSPGYTSDTETVLLQGSALRILSTLFRIGIPVSLFLLAVFFVDRLTGWRIWPPWRSL